MVKVLTEKMPAVNISPDSTIVIHKLGDEIGQATQFFSRVRRAIPIQATGSFADSGKFPDRAGPD